MIVDYEAGILKICDLGSAKKLNRNEKSVSYVCTRYYRSVNRFFLNFRLYISKSLELQNFYWVIQNTQQLLIFGQLVVV